MASHLSILTDFYIFEFLLSSLLRCNRCAVHDLARNNIDAICIKTNIQQELPRRLISLERISIYIQGQFPPKISGDWGRFLAFNLRQKKN
jgi:hypothetical protein